jgi:ribosome-binding factor A
VFRASVVNGFMENRAQQHHRERLGEALREEIAALVEGELGDPRIGLVSVTEAHLGPDGRTARVFVAVSGSDEEARESLEGLNAARGYIRHELTARLGLRQAPEIFFVLDRSERYGGRIEELLQRIEKRKKRS